MGQALENPLEKKYFSPEEYFILEEKAEDKHEYHNGEILAMSGGSLNHNIISGNLYAQLYIQLRGKSCRPFNSDMKLEIAQHNHYVYPDAMVVCGKVELAENRNDTLTNPILIVEVLSPSTADYDRSEKFRKYLSLNTLREYVLVYQDKHQVETYFKKSEQEWIFSVFEGEDKILTLPSLDLSISMLDIYEGID